MFTKFGNAKLTKNGYYYITTRKEGNNGKYLHVLIWEDYWNMKKPEGYEIHHLNHNRTDNRIGNLCCIPKEIHRSYHKKGNNHPLRNGYIPWNKGKTNIYSEETKSKIGENGSKARNTTGYFRVSKSKDSKCKQGFVWRYSYYENGKQKSIYSVDIKKLEQKVRARGLKWMEMLEQPKDTKGEVIYD